MASFSASRADIASLPTFVLGENGQMMEVEVIEDEGVKTGEGEVEAEVTAAGWFVGEPSPKKRRKTPAVELTEEEKRGDNSFTSVYFIQPIFQCCYWLNRSRR